MTTTLSEMRKTAFGSGQSESGAGFIFTKDQRLRYRPLEVAALRASYARVFVLTAGNLRGSEIAAVFVKALPRIHRILLLRVGPFVARLSQSGHITIT
jgi:hypothetical protein